MASNNWTYDPNSLYGSTTGGDADKPIVSGPNGFLANNEDAAYYRHIAPFAGGNDAFSNFVRGKMGEVIRNFRAAQATNSNLQFPDFLRDNAGLGAFQNMYQRMTAPWLRGETSASQMGAGRMKWYAGNR